LEGSTRANKDLTTSSPTKLRTESGHKLTQQVWYLSKERSTSQ